MAQFLKPFDPTIEYKCGTCGTRNLKTVYQCLACEQINTLPEAGPKVEKDDSNDTTSGAFTLPIAGSSSSSSTGGGFAFVPSTSSSSTTGGGGFSFAPSSSSSTGGGFAFVPSAPVKPSTAESDMGDNTDTDNDDDDKDNKDTTTTKDDTKDTKDESEADEQPIEEKKKVGKKVVEKKPVAVKKVTKKAQVKEVAPVEDDDNDDETKDTDDKVDDKDDSDKDDAEDVKPAPSNKRKRAAATASAKKATDDVDVDADDEPAPPKRSTRGRKPVANKEESDSEDKPVAKRPRRAAASRKVVSDDDDDDGDGDDEDDEQDQIPKTRRRARADAAAKKKAEKAKRPPRPRAPKAPVVEDEDESSEDETLEIPDYLPCRNPTWNKAVQKRLTTAFKSVEDTVPSDTALSRQDIAHWELSPHATDDVPGAVLTFGSGDMAQLGHGLQVRERKFPTPVAGLAEYDIVQVASSALHNLALTSDGRVFSWGCNDDGALGRLTETDVEEFTPQEVTGFHPDSTIVAIACGASHSLALDDHGVVYSWGAYRDASGLIGFNEKTQCVFAPTIVPGLQHRYIVQIACGESHSVVLCDNGEVYYWGDVFIGRRLSDRCKYSRLLPTQVIFPRGRNTTLGRAPKIADYFIVQIIAGGYSTFAVSSSGILWAWGPNNYSQTGIPHKGEENISITVPTIVPYFYENKIAILSGAAASQYTFFIAKDHSVYSVGRHSDGRLALGKDYKYTDRQEQSTPVLVPELSPSYLSSSASWKSPSPHFNLEQKESVSTQSDDYIIQISCGDAHALAVTAQGRVLSWGSGDTLQLGNGSDESTDKPYWVRSQQLSTFGKYVISACAGAQHSTILTKEAP